MNWSRDTLKCIENEIEYNNNNNNNVTNISIILTQKLGER